MGWDCIERRAKRRNPIGTLHMQFVNRSSIKATTALDSRTTATGLRSGRRIITDSSIRVIGPGLEAHGTLTTSAEENVDDSSSSTCTALFSPAAAVRPAAMEAQLRSVGDSLARISVRATGTLPSQRLLQLINPVWDSLNTQFYVAAGPIINFRDEPPWHAEPVCARVPRRSPT